MLFQSLLSDGAPERSGYDIEQIQVSMTERIEEQAFAHAWTVVARRHPVLSSSFKWRGVPEPRQVPQPGVVVPVERLSWADVSEEEQGRRRESFLMADRRRGFDLSVAPLMRVTLAELGNGRVELFWTFHHILIDGRSFAPVLAEVFETYGELLRRRAPETAKNGSRPYSDYIASLSTQDRRRSHAFFKALLAGKRAATPLPCAEPSARPLPLAGHGEVRRDLGRSLSEGLARLARDRQTTVGAIVQAAVALVLGRLTGDDDVLFGVTRSSRRSALNGAAEQMVGLFINSLPARVRIDESATVAQLLDEVRAQSLAMREHVNTPLVEIQEHSDVPRGSPLFETLLMFDTRELNRSLRALDSAWAERRCVVHEQPAVPLTLIVVDDETIELKVLYDRRRFRPEVVERVAAYLGVTLERLGRVERVGELDLMPPDERHRLLFGLNDTDRAFPDAQLIHQPFEAMVDRQPGAVAVEFEGEHLTYAELEVRANRLAHALLAMGLGPGRYVGVCLPRGFDLVTALLGIAKSGAAYVPIGPEYPKDRIAFMLEDAQATLVVSEARFASSLEVPVLEVQGGETSCAPTIRPRPRAGPADPCYAIYTSGSTGKPKGVELTHRAVVNTFDWVSRTFEVKPGDRLLFVTSPCFDLSVYDTFGALGAGATVVVASTERLAEPRALVKLLVDGGITIWDSAPAALQRLVPFLPSHGGSALRLVMLSGDWIPLSLPDALRSVFTRAQVMSLGGATEAAIWSNWFPIGELDPKWTSIPYGRPIQNAQYYVLDKRLEPVPLGVTGDLYISGTCLARGYLNRPELTRERFVSNPFRPGERMYLTGDLARHFDDGALEFLGRADFQVKIRGYRVELGEVEAALQAIEGVREAVATTFVDATGTKALVAYVVARQAAQLDQETLKVKLAVSLPDFMVPARVMVLPALPLSANGKVDRKALPAPSSQALATKEYVAPRTDTERRLGVIWEQVLEHRPIGVTDNFFALGGDSLLAVVLASRIERDLGIEVPLSRILEKPTVEGLAASLGTTEAPKGRHLVTLTHTGTRAPLVLLSGVGGFGFFYQGLATQLGDSQPVHVLHAVGAEDESEGFEHSIEELAAIYEPQILAVCPEGPVVLGGYSFGILVAFELARRLGRSGRPVPLLLSFDGLAPGHPRLEPMPGRLLVHLADFLSRDAKGRWAYLRGRIQRLNDRFFPVEDDRRLEPPASAGRATELRLRRLAAGLWRARDRYAPDAPINTDLLLMKATIPLEWRGCRTDSMYGWRSFIEGRIETVMLPGAHLELFNAENDARMARVIEPQLKALEAKGRR